MPRAWEVACLGILVADLVARPVEEIPPPGELRLVGGMDLCIGGCAASTAAALARLGVAVGALGKVGCDPLGDFLLQALRRDGVDTGAVLRDPAVATSATMALVGPTGERCFLHALGGNGALRREEVSLAQTGPAPVLHVGGTGLLPALDGAPLAALCAEAHGLGMEVSLDTAWDVSGDWTRLLPVLAHVDYFLPSQIEASRIFGVTEPPAIAAAALAHGVRAVAVKLGADGCYVQTADSAGRYLPALRGPVVDTTGAGDAFCAGFLAASVHGRDPFEAARLGTAAACMGISRLGAVAGVGSWAQALDVLARGGLPVTPRPASPTGTAAHQ